MKKKVNQADLKKEHERLRQQLAGADGLPGKKKRAGESAGRLRGAHDIATSISRKIHAVPPGQGDRGYLDMYLLQKERNRLLTELASLQKRRLQIDRKIADIDQELTRKEEKARAERTIPETESPGSQQPAAPGKHEYQEKDWQRLTIEY